MTNIQEILCKSSILRAVDHMAVFSKVIYMGVSPQILSSTHDLLFGTFGNGWQSVMKISTKENSNSPKRRIIFEKFLKNSV